MPVGLVSIFSREALKPRPRSCRTRPPAPAPARRPASAPSRGARRRPGATPTELRELRAQRDRLLEKFTVMQADLGGAFYEMAIRDHVRLDVLTRKAAELQRVDARADRGRGGARARARTGAAGLCASCGAPYAHRDAVLRPVRDGLDAGGGGR